MCLVVAKLRPGIIYQMDALRFFHTFLVTGYPCAHHFAYTKTCQLSQCHLLNDKRNNIKQCWALVLHGLIQSFLCFIVER